eukprot:14121744-Alexandrium_andersonii.AAC.1
MILERRVGESSQTLIHMNSSFACTHFVIRRAPVLMHARWFCSCSERARHARARVCTLANFRLKPGAASSGS